MSKMEELLKLLTTNLAGSIEATAGAVVGVGTLQAIWQAVVLDFNQRDSSEELTEEIRWRFGRWLSLALEFELAADVLRIAILPGWIEIGQLGAIVLLRTILNFCLQLEIDRAYERKNGIWR
jgi:uncharacterized membrane protein